MDSMTRSNMCKTFWLAKRVLCLSSTICPFNYEGWTPCVIDISDWRWLYHYFFTCHPTDQVSGTSITTMRGSHRNTHTCQTLPRPVQCSGCRRRQRHGWLHPQRDLLRLIAGWKRSVILPVWFSSCPIFFFYFPNYLLECLPVLLPAWMCHLQILPTFGIYKKYLINPPW